MKSISFVPRHSSKGKHDADEFRREAQAFAKIHPGQIVEINNHAKKVAMRAEVLDALRGCEAADIIAFFCHGWRHGIQFGFGIQHLAALAESMSHADAMQCACVVLYCCSTADGPGPGGDGGFADSLRDALCAVGDVWCDVYAHDRPGHTTRNPYVRLFSGEGSRYGGTGGTWIVAPGSALWRRWVAAMKTDLRFRFPLKPISLLHREVAGEDKP